MRHSTSLGSLNGNGGSVFARRTTNGVCVSLSISGFAPCLSIAFYSVSSVQSTVYLLQTVDLLLYITNSTLSSHLDILNHGVEIR